MISHRICLAVAFAVFHLNAMPQVATNNTAFTIQIEPQNQTVRVGDEVRLHIVLTDTSDQEILIPTSPSSTRAEFYYAIQIRRAQGEEVSETDYRHSAKPSRHIGSEVLVPIKPGGEMKEETVLSKQFEMPPGVYTVQLSRPATNESKDAVAKSNAVTITITP
jgi:hypothetical protein